MALASKLVTVLLAGTALVTGAITAAPQPLRAAPVAVTVPDVALSVPATARATSVGGRVLARWAPVAGTDPAVADSLRYDVQVRAVELLGVHSVRRVTGAAQTVVMFETRRSLDVPVVWSRGQDGYLVQLRARAALPSGAHGAWTDWRSVSVPADDTHPVRTLGPGWTRVVTPVAFNGSYLRSARRGAFISHAANAARIGVLVTMCRTCGKLRLTIGGSSTVVDTYAPTTRYQQVVGLRRVTPGFHQLEVRNLATSGRPYARVDGFVFDPQ